MQKVANCINVHNMDLEIAKKEIERNVKLAYENGKSVLNVIHGFNNGTKIKTWCLKHGQEIKYVERVDSGANEGITIFYIKVKIF